MRLPIGAVLALLSTLLVPAAGLPQARPDSANGDHVSAAVAELFAQDAERVERAGRLLEDQDIERFEITVCVDPEGGRFSCESAIHVRRVRGPLRLLLDEGLSISAVRDGNGAGLVRRRRGSSIEIDLPPGPSDGARVVEIHHAGTLPGVAGLAPSGGLALLGDGARWYPSPPEYDAATFRIVVRYPEGYSSVCTGSLAGMALLDEASMSRCTVGDVWSSDTPIPEAAVVVGGFGSSLSVSGDVFLGYHWAVGPGGEPRRVAPPERDIKELLRFLESCYGDYPYEWLNVVSVPSGSLGGAPIVPAPGLVVLEEDVWRRADGDGYRLDRLGRGLSHSWWRYWVDAGPVVASGLSAHGAVGWLEAMGEEEAATRMREQRRAEYVRALADSGGRAPLRLCLGATPSTDARICRGKAAAVLGLLEHVIGREAFCSALSGLAAEGGRVVDIEEVARAFETSAGRRLDWFLYEWFYRGSLPSYSLEYEVVADGAGPVVRGVIRQEGEIYRTPVPLTIDLGGWSYEEWVTIESPEQRFEIRTDMAPIEIAVDARRLIPSIDRRELAAAHFQRGIEAAGSNDWEVAVDEFGEAASLSWGSALYRFRYGDALVHAGRLAAGLDVLEEAVELDPDEPSYRLAMARLYLGALAYSEALEHFDEYVRLTEDPAGRLGRARALIGLERLDEARDAVDGVRAEIDTARVSDAIREELFVVLGGLYEAAGDTSEAVLQYERALLVNPVSDEARSRLEALRAARE
jgi:tetratricopeptide (TPR) repeat protein